VECIATGFLAGVALAQHAAGVDFTPPPRATALGSLIHYVSHADPGNYQPANISFDLLPPLEELPRTIARDRRARRARQCERALAELEGWFRDLCRGGVGAVKQGPCHSERSEESRSGTRRGSEQDFSLRSE